MLIERLLTYIDLSTIKIATKNNGLVRCLLAYRTKPLLNQVAL